MQDDNYHISDEEAEQKFEQDLNDLETEPPYMQADYEKFCAAETDAGAKLLWLQQVRRSGLKQDRAMQRMIKLTERDISKRPNSEVLPDAAPEPVLALIHLALSGEEDLRVFWDLVLESKDSDFTVRLRAAPYGDELLKEARAVFPEKRELSKTELFDFAARIMGLYKLNYATKPVELARKRYKTFKKNLEKNQIKFS